MSSFLFVNTVVHKDYRWSVCSFQAFISSEQQDERRSISFVLNKIVKDTGRFPTSYILKGVSCLTAFPILGGGFADVWQGNLLDGTLVALKALRIFANSKEDQERVRKVRTLYPLHLCILCLQCAMIWRSSAESPWFGHSFTIITSYRFLEYA